MSDKIDKLIFELKEELSQKYGEEFEKFYLVNNKNSPQWEGLISTNQDNERNVQYYTVTEEDVIKDEILFH
jgi:hypothetical protein